MDPPTAYPPQIFRHLRVHGLPRDRYPANLRLPDRKRPFEQRAAKAAEGADMSDAALCMNVS